MNRAAKRARRSEIAQVMRRSHRTREIHVQSRGASFDLGRLLDTVAHDRDLLATLVGLYLDDAPKLLTAIEESLRSCDRDALARAAHTLKGSTAVFAADETTSCAREMELAAHEQDWERAPRSYARLYAAVARLMRRG